MTISWNHDIEGFRARFGAGGTLVGVAAPGRVNLIGEHTDYHHGYVLPAAIERGVRAVARKRDDDRVVLFSTTFESEHAFALSTPAGEPEGWARRAEGVVRTVLQEAASPRGMEVWLDADLPVGGGLSSSAASMAALGMAAARLNDVVLEPKSFARLLQDAEHRFAGVRCGIMDPLAVLLATAGHALQIDCRSLDTRNVPVPSAWSLVVLDTGVRHDLASSEYNKRQAECATVLEALRLRRPEIRTLRDASADELDAIAGGCDEVGLRRCRHVLAENSRVRSAGDALANRDTRRIGELFAASHASLRDNYEVSCPELDAMVEAAWASPGCIGARMTGGGFGGSTVNLVAATKTDAFVAKALAHYREATGREGRAIVTAAAAGAQVAEI